MPAVAEKQPRWLMICKCGATVKPAAIAGGDPFILAGGERNLRAGADASLPVRSRLFNRAAGAAIPGSGPGDDRGADEGELGQLQRRRQTGGGVALEQHPPLEI